MIFRALILALCLLGSAAAQQTPLAAPPAASAPADSGSDCSAVAGSPFASLLCVAKAKDAEWVRIDREQTPEIDRYCDRTRTFRVVKQLQTARVAADDAWILYYQEYEQFVGEQIEALRSGKEQIDKDFERKIAKTNADVIEGQKLLDSKKKELANIPADATTAYKDSLEQVVKVLDQQVTHLSSTAQALKDTLEKRAYIDKEWENQKIVAHAQLEDVKANGESFIARYNELAELKLSKCVTTLNPAQAR